MEKIYQKKKQSSVFSSFSLTFTYNFTLRQRSLQIPSRYG